MNKYDLTYIYSDKLNAKQKAEYETLMGITNNEPKFYGVPLSPLRRRLVILNQYDEVMGCFEIDKKTYRGQSYYNSNRPYLLAAYRGNGVMEEALKDWYENRRPAIAWIADDNIPSIRLYGKLGFEPVEPWPGKEGPGHYYVLR